MLKVETTQCTGAILQFALVAAGEIAASFPSPYCAIPVETDMATVVFEDGSPVALACWMEWQKQIFIKTAWTAPSARRRGLYRMLVDELKRIAKGQALSAVTACVDGRNQESILAHGAIFGEPEQRVYSVPAQ